MWEPVILTVTLNTALDITHTVPALTPHASHRVTDVAERPGGKGLNVARVLAALGHETVVTGFAGGPTGEVLRSLLAPLPVRDALVPTTGTTRRTLAVVDTATGDTTQFNEPGPVVTPTEWAALLTTYQELLAGARAVALCGSLPPGIHVGAYADLVRRARAAGVPVLLDTSGEPLRRGIAARPDVVKPNADELAALTGSREPLRATRDARRRGAHAVVASLGPDGLLAVTPDGSWRAVPPARVKGNPTGAGDSAVAGLLSALVEGAPWPERLGRAAALATATVLAPAAGEFDPERYGELLERVTVTEQAAAA
ncbi:1-phosphofructokinase family hexose kinase [Streptomyces coeruleoprunus]